MILAFSTGILVGAIVSLVVEILSRLLGAHPKDEEFRKGREIVTKPQPFVFFAKVPSLILMIISGLIFVLIRMALV